jgi:hypothetical protein
MRWVDSPVSGTFEMISELLSGLCAVCFCRPALKAVLESPALSSPRRRFSGVGADSLRVGPHGGFVEASLPACSGAADVNRGQVFRRRLKDVAIVVHLHQGNRIF